jgi:hypothetical protein
MESQGSQFPPSYSTLEICIIFNYIIGLRKLKFNHKINKILRYYCKFCEKNKHYIKKHIYSYYVKRQINVT